MYDTAKADWARPRQSLLQPSQFCKPLTAALWLLALLLCSCSTTNTNNNTVTVYAAASLSEAFTEISRQYELATFGVNVQLSFAGSARLAAQIVAGANVDVFASADNANMTRVSNARPTAQLPTPFARNRLALIVPTANPAHITALSDLADNNLVLAVCALEVPCGTLAQQVLGDANIAANPTTYETNVRAVLTKVMLGEADAGLVYTTDIVAGANKVIEVPFSSASSATQQRFTEYPIVTVTDKTAAADFVSYVLSPKGQSILAKYGFSPP